MDRQIPGGYRSFRLAGTPGPPGRNRSSTQGATPIRAGGRKTVTLDIAVAKMEFEGEIVGGTVVYGEDEAEPLIGVTALESGGFEVGPRSQALKRLSAVLAEDQQNALHTPANARLPALNQKAIPTGIALMPDTSRTDAVRRWRRLPPEERRRRHLEAIRRHVANSMVMKGEPVDEAWIRERLSHCTRRRATPKPAKAP